MTAIKAARLQNSPNKQFLVIFILVLMDVISISLGFRLAVEFRRLLIPLVGGGIPPNAFTPILLQGLVIFILIYALTGLYPGFGRTAVEETQQIFYSLTLGYGVLALAIYFQQAGMQLSRWTFFFGWGLGCLLNIIFRFAARNRFSLFQWWGYPVLVVGSVEKTKDIIRRLTNSRRLGLRPVLVLDENFPDETGQVLNIPVLNSVQSVEIILKEMNIRYAIYVGHENQEQLLRWLGERFANVLVALDFAPLGSLWVKTMDLEGRLTLKTQYHLLDQKSMLSKRVFDLLIAGFCGLILSPFLVLIGLLIRLDSPGPVFYAQKRMGRGGKMFNCYKFRTMQYDADAILADLLKRDPTADQEYRKYHKLPNDPRITQAGRFLRKFSLDELPQFWNILVGELSLVGPRAYLPQECDDMGDYAALILRIRPGLTGWWQVMGRHNTTFDERLKLDEYYLSNWSLWMDLFIIIKTVWILLSGKGV